MKRYHADFIVGLLTSIEVNTHQAHTFMGIIADFMVIIFGTMFLWRGTIDFYKNR